MQFEWNEEKNRQNQAKHKVSFEEAKEIFFDPFHLSQLDCRFSYFEERWVSVGKTTKETILVVANLFFSEDGEEIIRIISARKANSQERERYENS